MGFAITDMKLTSTAFEDGGAIPKRHTGEGEDVSPALSWSKAPADAKAFALICHDPDAPLIKDGQYGYVHWVIYNIPGKDSGKVFGRLPGRSQPTFLFYKTAYEKLLAHYDDMIVKDTTDASS